MNPRTLAHDTACWYQSHLIPSVPHSENVRKYLGGIAEALTIRVLQSPDEEENQQQLEPQQKEPIGLPSLQTRKSGTTTTTAKSLSANDWRSYLASNQLQNIVPTLRDKKSTGLLDRRDRARLEAFLEGCALAVPDDVRYSNGNVNNKTSNNQKSSNGRAKTGVPTTAMSPSRELSLDEGLSGFLSNGNNGNGGGSLRPISSASSSSTRYYQFETADLTTRLELYLRTLKRARDARAPCVITQEPSRAMKARMRAIVRSFVNTVGCVRELGPTLMGLLRALTKELLAVETLGNELVRGLKRTSFATAQWEEGIIGNVPIDDCLSVSPPPLSFCCCYCWLEQVLCRSTNTGHPLRHLPSYLPRKTRPRIICCPCWTHT